MKIEESYLARRRFLLGMLGGGTAALGAGTCIPLGAYVANVHPEPPPPFLELEPAEYEVPPGGSRIVMYGAIPALVLRTPEPECELKVFVATCTHFDCTVSYQPDQQRIFCACHDGIYDLEGQVVAGPPPLPLPAFYTRAREGRLVIALEKDNLESAFPAT